jgi:hypothetical protein
MTKETLQKINIFISSPGHVGEERRIASEVIEQLNSMSHIADRYMMEADQADIFICILWSRMGTPVIDSKGKEHLSGTEYEFIKAYQSNQKTGKPTILLYRAMKSIPQDADFKQLLWVQDFFNRFDGKDAEFKGMYCKYKNNEEFKVFLRRDLDTIISETIQQIIHEKPAQVPVNTSSKLQAHKTQPKKFITHNRRESDMGEIFLCYKSEDETRAKIITEALVRQGYSVWWDRIIPPGKTYGEVIEEALDPAKCVIVLWSKESVKSDWVKNEKKKIFCSSI